MVSAAPEVIKVRWACKYLGAAVVIQRRHFPSEYPAPLDKCAICFALSSLWQAVLLISVARRGGRDHWTWREYLRLSNRSIPDQPIAGE